MTEFVKMHGLGNDFVIFDEEDVGHLELSKDKIRQLCDRRRGIGCDQLIILQPAHDAHISRHVKFFNPDGSEASACGNGSRCIVGLLHAKTKKDVIELQTKSSHLQGRYEGDGFVEVNMGSPRTSWKDVPLSRAFDTLHLPIQGDPACVSMGNPHVTFFVKHYTQSLMGMALSDVSPFFPQGVNVGFAHILHRDEIRLKVHERGAGFTLACGTGACAAVVNAVRRGYVERECRVEMDGGTLYVRYCEKDNDVYLKGAVAFAFTGDVSLGDNIE